MAIEYEVVEQGRFEEGTIYRGESLASAMEMYREYGCYSSGPLALYRTADGGKSYEWLCTDGKTFLPC